MTVADRDRLDRQLNDYDIVWALNKSKNLEIACIKRITITPKFWGPPTATPPAPVDKWLMVFFNRGSSSSHIAYSEIFNNNKITSTFRRLRVDYNQYNTHLNVLLVEDPKILSSQAIRVLKEHTRKQKK